MSDDLDLAGPRRQKGSRWAGGLLGGPCDARRVKRGANTGLETRPQSIELRAV
jgi:hypothetical protein